MADSTVPEAGGLRAALPGPGLTVVGGHVCPRTGRKESANAVRERRVFDPVDSFAARSTTPMELSSRTGFGEFTGITPDTESRK
jgi:hypothetical protein